MVRITEELLRKSSEHNEGIISTLEEVALHQREIEKIENIGNWCRELRILDLTSNVIPKIENLHKLKKLEYLKLGLNVIEKVENLEGCESLKKLDLTVNFIGELTSIESLQSLVFFEEMYLMGNPCTEFDGYREYVVATLPCLKFLDGHEITKSERIRALQAIHEIRPSIIQQQRNYLVQREKKKEQAAQTQEISETSKKIDEVKLPEEEAAEEKKFWDEQVPYTPENRMRVHNHIRERREKKENAANKSTIKEKKERRLVADDGRVLNINEAKFDFTLTEDDEEQTLVLDIAVYRYMDTSLISIDINPTFVTGTIRGKLFQLVLPEEVQASSSKAQRLTTNGHLVLTMPKLKQVIKPVNVAANKSAKSSTASESAVETSGGKRVEKLEVDPSAYRFLDYTNIVNENKNIKKSGGSKLPWWAKKSEEKVEKEPDKDFVDDPDVPPLI